VPFSQYFVTCSWDAPDLDSPLAGPAIARFSIQEVMMRIYQFELRVLLTTGEGAITAEALELSCMGSGADTLEAIASLAAGIKGFLEQGEVPYREPSHEMVERWISSRGGQGEAVTLKIWSAHDTAVAAMGDSSDT
jgi:hypothetical protein